MPARFWLFVNLTVGVVRERPLQARTSSALVRRGIGQARRPVPTGVVEKVPMNGDCRFCRDRSRPVPTDVHGYPSSFRQSMPTEEGGIARNPFSTRMTIIRPFISPSLAGTNQKKTKAKQMDSGFRRNDGNLRLSDRRGQPACSPDLALRQPDRRGRSRTTPTGTHVIRLGSSSRHCRAFSTAAQAGTSTPRSTARAMRKRRSETRLRYTSRSGLSM